jgi:hypothetical protein
MNLLSSLIYEWLAQEKFRTNKSIKHALKWVLNINNFNGITRINLFENFIHEGFPAKENLLKASEKTYFLKLIELAKTNIPINWIEFVGIENKLARRKIGRWLSNVSRNDLGLLPENPNQIIPFSIICSPDNLNLIENTYKALGYKDRLQWLNNLIDDYKFLNLGELLPFTVGYCIIICKELMSAEDTVLLPRIMSQFFYNNQLGVVVIPNISLIVIRKGILKYSRLPIEQKTGFKDIISLAKSLGWEISEIKIKY